jgi:hypothetical protein
MRFKPILQLIVCSLLLTGISKGQGTKVSLSGTLKDASTGETMIGASVIILERPGIGAVSNEYGFYSITTKAGKYHFIFHYLGYVTDTVEIDLQQNKRLDVKLTSKASKLREVVIESKKENENLQTAQAGVEKINPKEISKLPVLFGERDILKTIQLLPGIKGAGEGNTGFNVRGGTTDQNLILLDEAPVYNASHLLGFFSTFNSDAIKDVTIYKGTQPSPFGGRLSSVLDIKMNDGNSEEYKVNGGIGLISSKLSVEGPTVKDKGSFLVTARRTYADLFLKLSPDSSVNSNSLYFYDINLKTNYSLGSKDRLFLSGYFGRDVLGLGGQFGINWGNQTGTLRWNHIYNSKLFSNTSFIYSKFDYKIAITSGTNDFSITSKIQDVNLKHEFQYFAGAASKWKFGVNAIHHSIVPGQIEASDASSVNPITLPTKYSLETGIYANHDYQLTDRLNIIYGLRLTGFSLLGNGSNDYTFGSDGKVTGTQVFAMNEIYKTYWNLEPRFAMSYRYDENSSVKIAMNRNVQNLHLITNSTTSNPTDLWLASSRNTQPEIADQLSAGWFRNFSYKGHRFEFSVETYFKSMQHQIDYRNGANTRANDKLEGELLYGQGRAYGLEVFLKKKTGKFTGWLSYTLSRTERQFSDINNGNWYAAKQDRTHDISLVGTYDHNERWSFSALWVYYTGNAVTFPSGKYQIGNTTEYVYTERNGYRMPDYHRLDLSATYTVPNKKKFKSSWNFSIYNAYGRQNAYTISFRENKDNPNITEAVRTSLFRWVPSVTYTFQF